jgi:T5orf172 domain-containing protein
MHEITIQCRGCGAINIYLLDGSKKIYKCDRCKFVLLRDKLINGFIYILSNENMPGLMKIGYSRRTVEERVRELSSQTGVPKSFTIEAYFGSENPEDDEKKVHHELLDFKVEGKEFFKLEASKAVKEIMLILDSKPIYLIDFLSISDIDRVQNLINKCPMCGESIIPDPFRLLDKCLSCGWSRNIRSNK